MKIILASSSPRRRELMHYITDDFDVCTTNEDEILPENLDPYYAAEYLSLKKAAAASKHHPENIVIGCDTVIILNGKIIGKPKDSVNAFNILRAISGKQHDVVTGCTIICKGKIYSFSQKTSVMFYNISDNEIEEYIASGEPFDKAGGYGIQGKGALFIKGIEGDYYNVMGLPIAALAKKLKEVIKENKGDI